MDIRQRHTQTDMLTTRPTGPRGAELVKIQEPGPKQYFKSLGLLWKITIHEQNIWYVFRFCNSYIFGSVVRNWEFPFVQVIIYYLYVL